MYFSLLFVYDIEYNELAGKALIAICRYLTRTYSFDTLIMGRRLKSA